jgi:hypothetical protein
VVHDVRYYAPEDIRFGMRYADAVSAAQDGTRVADLTRIRALAPDVGDREATDLKARKAFIDSRRALAYDAVAPC